MKIDYLEMSWRPDKGSAARACSVRRVPEGLSFSNDSPTSVCFCATLPMEIDHPSQKGLCLTFRSTSSTEAAASLHVNGHSVPLNAAMAMSIRPPISVPLVLRIASRSQSLITELSCEVREKPRDLLEEVGSRAEVLVVSPAYPSSESLYHCGFVHARVREYKRLGLDVDVAWIAPETWFQTLYEIDGVRVFRSGYSDLKRLIARRQYKVIVIHFADEAMMQLLDSCVCREQVVFICHGPETLFEYLPNVVRPYFSREVIISAETESLFALKRRYVAKYAKKDYVAWVFVSDWLKEYSEELLGLKFQHARVVNNVINETIFPYREKTVEHRKKILVIRKFDNIRQHAIDQCVLAIRELSRRPFFKDLTFSFYGDGNYFDQLLAPLRSFPNVRIQRGFLTHDQIREIHAEHGIALLPSRHDAHAVAMSEAASSGLVVVGSDVTSNGDFMNAKVNRTLAHPERPKELADIIERLYRDPEEFLAISRRMSEETRARCSVAQTVGKEAELIQERRDAYGRRPASARRQPSDPPVLSVIVPTYNLERYVERCLLSLLSHNSAHRIEVLVVNDGSTDGTSRIAHDFEANYPGVVKVLDKANGGHGSAINVGIREARGRYVRLVDGDDWVDSEGLAEQVRRLEAESADLVLTESSFEDAHAAVLRPGSRFDALQEGVLYHFDDLTFPPFGLSHEAPSLPTSTLRRACLLSADFIIDEKCAYVDQEWNAFALTTVQTVRRYALDIYRYFIGREGQTVSRESWAKKHQDHRRVITRLLQFVANERRLSDAKRRYVIERIIAPVVDTQVFMYDQILRWESLATFLLELREHPEIHRVSIDFIRARPGQESWRILNNYHHKLSLKQMRLDRTPIIPYAVAGSNERPRSYAARWLGSSSMNFLKGFFPSAFTDAVNPDLTSGKRRLLRQVARHLVPRSVAKVYQSRRRPVV